MSGLILHVRLSPESNPGNQTFPLLQTHCTIINACQQSETKSRDSTLNWRLQGHKICRQPNSHFLLSWGNGWHDIRHHIWRKHPNFLTQRLSTYLKIFIASFANHFENHFEQSWSLMNLCSPEQVIKHLRHSLDIFQDFISVLCWQSVAKSPLKFVWMPFH